MTIPEPQQSTTSATWGPSVACRADGRGHHRARGHQNLSLDNEAYEEKDDNVCAVHKSMVALSLSACVLLSIWLWMLSLYLYVGGFCLLSADKQKNTL